MTHFTQIIQKSKRSLTLQRPAKNHPFRTKLNFGFRSSQTSNNASSEFLELDKNLDTIPNPKTAPCSPAICSANGGGSI